jgi:molybdenum cofactor guanylyltransferase
MTEIDIPLPAFSVAMLAGGASRRMGQDKALLDVDEDGDPMAARVLVASILAGASEAIAVGGDRAGLQSHGWQYVADNWPGEGPLGGLITALARASFPIVVVLGCDHPDVDPDEITAMVAALHDNPSLDAAVPTSEGQPYVMHSVWRAAVLPILEQAFRGGERAPVAMLRTINWVPLRVVNQRSITDLDTPEQLADRRASRVS